MRYITLVVRATICKNGFIKNGEKLATIIFEIIYSKKVKKKYRIYLQLTTIITQIIFSHKQLLYETYEHLSKKCSLELLQLFVNNSSHRNNIIYNANYYKLYFILFRYDPANKDSVYSIIKNIAAHGLVKENRKIIDHLALTLCRAQYTINISLFDILKNDIFLIN